MSRKMTRALLSAGTVAVLGVTAATGAFGTVIVPPTARSGSLIQVGPVSSENGFPVWYRDKDASGATSRLEVCLPVAPLLSDPFCAPPALPDPAAPMVYPTNYPDEMFYQMASAEITTATSDVLVEMNLEGAYANGPVIAGDEMVFGRIRIRDRKSNYTPGTTWRVTHPYGIDEIVADDRGQMNMTQDVGTTPGAFGGALGSRIGPFLKWDPNIGAPAPAGYTGDPNVLHAVVGSPYGTNFLKVELKNGDGSYTTLAQTDQFSVQGRYATNSGVDVDSATYTQPATGPATIDVLASSEVNQSIQVSANPALGFAATALRTDQGRYLGHLPVSAAAVPVGATVEVVNAGDKPIAKKTATLTDLVTIASAVYTVGPVGATAPANSLVVTASSSDALTLPALTVTGFGPLVAGTASFATTAPPRTVTVTSARGGSATLLVSVVGPAVDVTLPVAAFTAPTSVTAGQPVLMDGTGSSGGPLTYAFSQVSGPTVALTGATTANASFTPTVAGAYVMQLVVTGPTGLVSVPVTRLITVTPAATVFTANAGPDQIMQRGKLVTLDASATVGQQSMVWSQTAGTTATLSSTTATKPTFSYPLMALPTAPVGSLNTGYVRNNTPLTFRMTATPVIAGPTAFDDVVITPTPESFTAVTARYRTGRNEWRVTGTSSILAGQRVTVVMGPFATGRTIGTATVDAVGAFSVRAGALPDPTVGTPDQTQVTVISATGGIGTFGLSITN
jgi:hypothetical protein